MHKVLYIFLLVLSGCSAGNSTVTDTPSNDVPLLANSTVNDEELTTVITLGVKQVATYQDLTLRLIDIEDSRCPTGTECIWAGQLIVTFEVSNAVGESEEITLIRKRESEVAHAFGYNVVLLDVTPYPKKGKMIQLSDQLVTLELKKVK